MKLYQSTGKGTDEGMFLFDCPACKFPHGFTVGPGKWTWNGNREKPSVSPSLRVTNSTGLVCHSFVYQGRIEFLSDCTHALKGTMVDLPDCSLCEEPAGQSE